MKKVFDEVAPLFESPFFHIGTDEYRLGLVRDKKERARLGELFRRYINDCVRYLEKKHHKIVRIWSGYEHMPGTTEPGKSIWIDMWVTSDALNKSRAGYKFLNSSHFYTYIVPGMPYYGVNDRFLYENWSPLVFRLKDPKGVLKPGAPGLMGGKLHVWNDGGPTGYTWNEIARLTWPSLLAVSEKLWGTQGSRDYKTFLERASRIDEPPAVALLDRKARAGEDGLVWRLEKKPLWFIANSNYSLRLPGDPGNLEYPWTATFTVERLSDAKGDEVLLSSDLAAFYVELTWTKKNRKTKQETVRRGVACVRAKQAPGPDPLHSYNPDVIVFDYQVPLKKKVRLTFVGERKRTSLYADGKLVGRTPVNKPRTPGTTSLHIGERQDGYCHLRGTVDEVWVYDRALSPEEIALRHVAAGAPPKDPRLAEAVVAHVGFDADATIASPPRDWRWVSQPVKSGKRAVELRPEGGFAACALAAHGGPVTCHLPFETKRARQVLKTYIPRLGGSEAGWKFLLALLAMAPNARERVGCLEWFLRGVHDHPREAEALAMLRQALGEADEASAEARLREFIARRGFSPRTLYDFHRRYLGTPRDCVREWQILGPFPNPKYPKFGPTLPPDGAPVRLGATFEGARGPVTWKPYLAPSDYVDLDPLLEPNEYVVAYAACWVRAPKAQPVFLAVGSDDDSVVWLNGREVLRGTIVP